MTAAFGTYLVGEAVLEPDERRDGGEVHNGPAAVLEHVADRRLGAEEHALDVHVIHAVHVSTLGDEHVANVADAGVVHEDVDLLDLREGGLDGGLVGDVAFDRRGAAGKLHVVDLGRSTADV